MTDKAFELLCDRELRRFHRAVGKVVDALLIEKYESTRQVKEYRQYAKICGFVKNSLEVIDLFADKAVSLFDNQDGRRNWDIYLAGLRRLFREMPQSYLFRFVLPMFGLDGLREQLVAYSAMWLEQTHAAQRFFREADQYLEYFDRGLETAQEYGSQDKELVRLYASLKTWETQQGLNSFFSDLEAFLSSSVDVFITSPIQLYLMLNRDTMALIFKSLSASRLSDITDGRGDVSEMAKLADFLHDAVESSTTLEITREVATRVVKEYAQDLREDQLRLRAQLPNRAMRESFVYRFEAGVLFQRE